MAYGCIGVAVEETTPPGYILSPPVSVSDHTAESGPIGT